MQACIAEEADEVAKIPVPNASAHPGAVMVVHFDAEAAVRAVEGPRRAHDLARSAVGELFRLTWVQLRLLVCNDLEAFKGEEGLHGLHLLHDFIPVIRVLVGHFVRLHVVD